MFSEKTEIFNISNFDNNQDSTIIDIQSTKSSDIAEIKNTQFSQTIKEQKFKKILYIVFVYCLYHISLLIYLFSCKNEIEFINSNKHIHIDIIWWLIVHAIINVLDGFTIISMILFAPPQYAIDCSRLVWLIIFMSRLVSLLCGSYIFWNEYSNNYINSQFVKIIIWTTLIIGWLVFVTTGWATKLNQFYFSSFDIFDIY